MSHQRRLTWHVLCIALICLPQLRAQTTTVGRSCTESTECNDGAYCASNKRCACLTSFVDISGYCWRKINPGEAGCTQNRQCEAVWPNSYCSSGTCKCGNNQDPLPTVDGYVCVNYGECPIGEHWTKFYQFGVVAGCQFGTFYSPVSGAYGQTAVTQHTRPYDCPETYDCICSSPTCTVTDVKFCCPSRNYACSLNYDEGVFPNNGAGTVNRYYHDPVTNECKTFSYRGLRGNANNFESKEHCESYCLETCERGRPEYASQLNGNAISGSTGRQIPQVVTCDVGSSSGGTSQCNSQFECKAHGTRNLCCPNIDIVCSRTGAIAYTTGVADYITPTTTAPYDAGVLRDTGAETYSRWYYDRSESRCRAFTWNGQGGNFNRFLTQSHCEQYCSKTVCTAGIPLKDTTGITNYRCSGSSTNCPTTHECKSNLCCPRPQFVCKLAMAAGNCANYVNRWWFNAQTGNCEEFTYSGCQGNSNNFENYNDCQTFCKDAKVEPLCIQGKAQQDSNSNFLVCGGAQGTISQCSTNYYCYYDGNTYGCCPNQAYTCQLSYDSGRECGPEVTRWYYDSTTRRCQTYTYKGCDGNSNNFATQQDCNEYCRIDNCPDGGSPTIGPNGLPQACTLDTDCSNTHYCAPISSYGQAALGGLQVSNFCCPSKAYICGLSRDSGTRCSSTTIPRFWFNSASRTCETFTYNGCAGNRNNFATLIQCQNYCLSSACPTGDVVSLDVVSGIVTSCTAVGGTGVVSDGCGTGYTCYNSPILNQNVCCGLAPGTQGMCPPNSRPFISALTLQPQQCTPNIQGSCPGGYFCWYSSGGTYSEAFYCCQNANAAETGLCPPKLKAVPGSLGAPYKFCSPSSQTQNNVFGAEQGSCSDNEYCQYSERVSQYICCGSESDLKPNVCPPQPIGLTPYYIGRDYRNCNPLALQGTSAACPDDAACLWINTEIQYICCREPLSSRIGIGTGNIRHKFDRSKGQEEDPSVTPEQYAEHCGGQLGFRPVKIEGQPAYCSPSDGNSCSAYRDLGNIVHCMRSNALRKFVCCYSLWNDSTDKS